MYTVNTQIFTNLNNNTVVNFTLTQAHKRFIVQFIADVVQHLTTVNCENADEEEYFVRLTDALEVLDNLQMLYASADDDSAVFNFTLAQAAQALLCYDTEYRECIAEEFEDACNDAAANDSTFANLAVNIFAAY
tara:strand:- start:373 stop:774 length:402 start_codon:yes stop_codon:yes gene_type:complete